MKKLLFVSLFSCVLPLCHASLIGTTVTGVINFGGGATNYYDPANNYVPSGYQNSAGNQDSPTVTIVGGNEFGFADVSNLDVTSFSDSGFTFSDTSYDGGGSSISLSFTDTAFTSVSEISSTFSGLTYGISGDVITINIPGFSTSEDSTLTASFSLGPVTAPEPSSLALLALGIAGLVCVRKRFQPAQR